MGVKKAFVTGANGFLGANLTRELLAQGWDVTVFHRKGSDLWRLEGLKVNYTEGSLGDAASIESAMPEKADAVFHLAARVSFWRGDNEAMRCDNVEGTRAVAEAALKRQARRFILTSSVSAYGYSKTRIAESSPKNGVTSGNGYMRTKAQSEGVVLQAMTRGLDPVILNPATVMGRLDRDHWGNSMKKVKEGKMPAAPPGTSSFCDVVEVAKAHVAAFEKGKSGENYILGGVDGSYKDVFQAMEDILGVHTRIKTAPEFALVPYGWLSQFLSNFTHKAPYVTPELVKFLSAKLVYDSSKAMRELGFQQPSLKEILEDCWKSLN